MLLSSHGKTFFCRVNNYSGARYISWILVSWEVCCWNSYLNCLMYLLQFGFVKIVIKPYRYMMKHLNANIATSLSFYRRHLQNQVICNAVFNYVHNYEWMSLNVLYNYGIESMLCVIRFLLGLEQNHEKIYMTTYTTENLTSSYNKSKGKWPHRPFQLKLRLIYEP